LTDTLIAGNEPLAYQWRRDGLDLPGATNASLFITNAALSDQGIYSRLVSNPVGCAISPEVSLLVGTPPAPRLEDLRAEATRLHFTLVGLSNTQYQVETSVDVRHWTWCCSCWTGPVSIDKPPGDSLFVRVGIYDPSRH